MSTFNFLLPNADGIDTGLDALFSSSLNLKKRKSAIVDDEQPFKEKKIKKDKKSKKDKVEVAEELVKKIRDKSKMVKPVLPSEQVDHDSEEETIPVPIPISKKSKLKKTKPVQEVPEDSAIDSASDESDIDHSKLIHESLLPSSSTRPHKKVKYVPLFETPTQKNARTIFVGNLPLIVASKKVSSLQLIVSHTEF